MGTHGSVSQLFRLWLGVGNLNNAGNAGLSCVNGNNGLSNANWNIASRHPDY